jgi:hypothetical protein
VLLLIVVFAILTSVLFACRFIVLSTLLCCGGFIYKTRVEHQAFFLSSYLEFFIMLLSNTIQSSVESMVTPHQFQYGLHALPGMNTVSAFLDVVRTLL